MGIGFDVRTLRFADPTMLWLLAVPAFLLIAWLWQMRCRRRDARRLQRSRQMPVRERMGVFGGLLFWLCLILATALVIAAVARPQAMSAGIQTTAVDLVVLQDGSSSMWTQDVPGDRWQRSMKFLRTLASSLEWKNDRIALALFAHIAAPQVRLTRDPNTFFFFLDHLDKQSPFRLEADPTWDTNIELGIYWGVRLIQKDEEMNGKSTNVKGFVLVTDGQSWSGTIEKSLALARAKELPVYVVGVGTVVGGPIPDPLERDVIHASLDRPGLLRIADAGRGHYFELDRQTDSEIANTIIGSMRRRAGPRGVEETAEDLYWSFLLTAAALVCIGVIFLRERAELWLQVAGVSATLAIFWSLVR